MQGHLILPDFHIPTLYSSIHFKVAQLLPLAAISTTRCLLIALDRTIRIHEIHSSGGTNGDSSKGNYLTLTFLRLH